MHAIFVREGRAETKLILSPEDPWFRFESRHAFSGCMKQTREPLQPLLSLSACRGRFTHSASVSNMPSIGLSWVLTCEEDRGLNLSWPSLVSHPDGADADPVITVRSQTPRVIRLRGSRKGEDLYTYDIEHGHHGAAYGHRNCILGVFAIARRRPQFCRMGGEE